MGPERAAVHFLMERDNSLGLAGAAYLYGPLRLILAQRAFLVPLASSNLPHPYWILLQPACTFFSFLLLKPKYSPPHDSLTEFDC